MLASRLVDEVDSGVRARGAEYFRQGCVEIVEGDANAVKASVSGSREYLVNLTRTRDGIKVWCDCPYYQDRLDPCKHIWATVLAAEARGHLSAVLGMKHKPVLELDETYADANEFDDGYDENDENDYESYSEPTHHSYHAPTVNHPRQTKKKATWRAELASFQRAANLESATNISHWNNARQVVYVLDRQLSQQYGAPVIELATREPKQDGGWTKPKKMRLESTLADRLTDPLDRRLAGMLLGAKQDSGNGYSYGYSYGTSRFHIGETLREPIFELLCQTGRFFFRKEHTHLEPDALTWDASGPWQFLFHVGGLFVETHCFVEGMLARGDERIMLSKAQLIFAGGPLLIGNQLAGFMDHGCFPLCARFFTQGPMKIPVGQAEQFLTELYKLPRLPPLELPPELQVQETTVPPKPHLRVKKSPDRGYYDNRNPWLIGELAFDYEGTIVPEMDARQRIFLPESRKLLLRDESAEGAARSLLHQLGCQFQSSYGYRATQRTLASRNLPKLVSALLAEGWHVEAEGKLYKNPGKINIEVNSGIDWFELHGEVEFGETSAKLPELLAALKRGDNCVRLDDGTFGILPQDWLKKYGPLAGLGTENDGHLRFARAQVGLLDALLATQPEATCDATFAKLRDELRRFDGIESADPTPKFTGELRAYQRDGLGWLQFLQKFSFGGCLADDMGLGKTVQVLALLESRRELRAKAPKSNGKKKERPGPSLVVVPRSLIFNWKQEAARFTPQLRILDHTGIERAENKDRFDEFDVILTTYGTLRRDALHFKDRIFDYVILDESQAIKNATSESAKAARLLRGNYRLAMSGTPVENHLGELWSLFEFLNPGMLGAASVFRLGGIGARNPEPETRALLAKALRPFILRRTKAQVAKDLPAKTEQTIFCELDSAQRKLYDELRNHYREALLGRIAEVGMNKAKIMILEALLRLRQAACHPGLIDSSKLGKPSAKLDALLPQLQEVLDEGQKVLVFSQFTSFLAILKQRLKAENVSYEYLDGKTRDRKSCVDRFQTDPNCKLFLISLKAGGLGLNLTAAEYVFLLDPWWNPAVEAQAIDRTHRIGQTKPVFAYRLIAKDTVEEKVLELQAKKRDLADAIINEDNSLIRNLGREDLELLLS